MADKFAAKLRQWLDLLDEDPIEAMNVCKEDFEYGTQSENERKYVTIALMSEFLIEIRGSGDAAKRFANLPFWSKTGHRLKEDNLHTYVARYMLGAKETRGALYQQALSWGKVVKHCAEENFEPEDIPDYLSEQGIYKLIDRIDAGELPSAVKAVTAKPKTATRDAGDSLHEDTELPENDRDGTARLLSDDKEKTHRSTDKDNQRTMNDDGGEQGHSQDEGRGSTKSRRRSINLDKEVSFEAGAYIGRILGIEEGDLVQVTLERVASQKDWKRLRATKIEIIRKSHALL